MNLVILGCLMTVVVPLRHGKSQESHPVSQASLLQDVMPGPPRNDFQSHNRSPFGWPTTRSLVPRESQLLRPIATAPPSAPNEDATSSALGGIKQGATRVADLPARNASNADSTSSGGAQNKSAQPQQLNRYKHQPTATQQPPVQPGPVSRTTVGNGQINRYQQAPIAPRYSQIYVPPENGAAQSVQRNAEVAAPTAIQTSIPAAQSLQATTNIRTLPNASTLLRPETLDSPSLQRLPPVDSAESPSTTSTASAGSNSNSNRYLARLLENQPPSFARFATSHNLLMAQEQLPPPTQLNAPDHTGTQAEEGSPSISSVLKSSTTGGSSTYLTLEQLRPLIGSEAVLYSPHKAPLGINDVIGRALAHSKQIQIQRLLPSIEQQRIGEAIGNFDWAVFVDNTLRDSTQRIEAAENQNDSFNGRFQSRFGLRKNTRLGGAFEISERLRALDRNEPPSAGEPRTASQLRLRFSQELLRDAGRQVTESQVLVASLMTESQSADSLAEMANVLVSVSDAYWLLYRNRGEVLIQSNLHKAAERVVAELKIRKDIDVEDSLLAQAAAAVFNRKRDWALAQAEVKRQQDTLHRLINDQSLDSNTVEILTTESPSLQPLLVSMDEALAMAFQTRPEIRAALQRFKIAGVDRDVASNQVKPRLTLILEAQFSGTDGEGQAATTASGISDDSVYGALLNFEYPIRNRQRRSALQRARLEVVRQQKEFEDIVQQVALDVKDAMRVLEANTAAVQYTHKAVQESLKELAYRETRMKLAPQRDALPSVTLDQLLRAQQRLGDAQLAHLDALVSYNQAVYQLRRATGQLVESVGCQF